MKKMIKGFFKMLWRHKILSIICFMAFIVVVVLFYIFCSVFVGGSDVYGNRLAGIEEVEFTKKDLSKIEDKIKEHDLVDSVSLRIQGKIVYINIVYKKDASVDKAKEIAKGTLELFDEDELEFYDLGYILTQVSEDKEDSGFKITGTKGPKTKGISFIKS